MNENDEAIKLLSAVQRLAAKQLRAAKAASAAAKLVLVDGERYERLELLAIALRVAMEKATHTRDYKDAVGEKRCTYSGKKHLLPRNEFNDVLTVLLRLLPKAKVTAAFIGGMEMPTRESLERSSKEES